MVSSAVSQVSELLEDYRNRGVFRGLSNRTVREGVVAFTMTWHADRPFNLTVDANKQTLTLPIALPGIPARSSMDREFRAFVASHHDPILPAHRRIDPSKAAIRYANRRGNVSLTMTIEGRDFRYGAQRLLHLMHETFIFFLADGRYFEYRVEHLGLDPDRP